MNRSHIYHYWIVAGLAIAGAMTSLFLNVLSTSKIDFEVTNERFGAALEYKTKQVELLTSTILSDRDLLLEIKSERLHSVSSSLQNYALKFGVSAIAVLNEENKILAASSKHLDEFFLINNAAPEVKQLSDGKKHYLTQAVSLSTHSEQNALRVLAVHEIDQAWVDEITKNAGKYTISNSIPMSLKPNKISQRIAIQAKVDPLSAPAVSIIVAFVALILCAVGATTAKIYYRDLQNKLAEMGELKESKRNLSTKIQESAQTLLQHQHLLRRKDLAIRLMSREISQKARAESIALQFSANSDKLINHLESIREAKEDIVDIIVHGCSRSINAIYSIVNNLRNNIAEQGVKKTCKMLMDSEIDSAPSNLEVLVHRLGSLIENAEDQALNASSFAQKFGEDRNFIARWAQHLRDFDSGLDADESTILDVLVMTQTWIAEGSKLNFSNDFNLAQTSTKKFGLSRPMLVAVLFHLYHALEHDLAVPETKIEHQYARTLDDRAVLSLRVTSAAKLEMESSASWILLCRLLEQTKFTCKTQVVSNKELVFELTQRVNLEQNIKNQTVSSEKRSMHLEHGFS